MKIVMLCDFFNESLEYQENLLTKYYRKHGHEVTLIASTFESVFDYYAGRYDKSAPARTYEHDGAKVMRLPYRFHFLKRLHAFPGIDAILEAERPDLIFVHGISLNFPEAIDYVTRHRSCRMIMDFHADYSNSGRNWFSLRILHGVVRKWFLDRARPHLQKIFPITPGSARFLDEVYAVPAEEMELLPLGADTDVGGSVKASGDGQRLRESFGIPPGHTVIFTGGKLEPSKRTEAIIEAVRALARDDVHLFVIGDAATDGSEYKQSLLRLAHACPNVRFTGWLGLQDVYRYLAMSDVAVFPAGQSILWQKAISMGLPLVVGDVADARNSRQDVSYMNLYGNIIVLEGPEPMEKELLAVLQRLLGDAQLRARMAEGAVRVTEELLTWDRLIQQTLRFNQPGGSPA